MKLGIDMDGVLANFFNGFQQVLIDVTGKDLFPGKFPVYVPHCWDWANDLGYTRQETGAAWKVIRQHEFFWSALDELPGARHLRSLDLQMDHDIYFITSRVGRTAKVQTEKWLMRRGIVHPTVLICQGNKGHIAAGLELDFFIDDKMGNVIDVCEHSPETKVYLLSYPYNDLTTDTETQGKFKRVMSVSEALRLGKVIEEVEV